MKQLIDNIHETGEQPSDFSEITMVASKKPEVTKCSDLCAISIIAHEER
jgi:hypothetical protein